MRITQKQVETRINTLNTRVKFRNDTYKFGLDSAYNAYRLVIYGERNCIHKSITGFVPIKEVYNVIEAFFTVLSLTEDKTITPIKNW